MWQGPQLVAKSSLPSSSAAATGASTDSSEPSFEIAQSGIATMQIAAKIPKMANGFLCMTRAPRGGCRGRRESMGSR